jgi:hypothetical protein
VKLVADIVVIVIWLHKKVIKNLSREQYIVVIQIKLENCMKVILGMNVMMHQFMNYKNTKIPTDFSVGIRLDFN